MSVSIKNTTRHRTPRLPYENLKDGVLGSRYELSLVFCGDNLSRKLNRIYKKKNKPTNTLSFSLDKTCGEIFINLSRTKEFGAKNLFIHSLLHLKGMKHGYRMSQAEKKYLHGATNRSRHRRRELRD